VVHGGDQGGEWEDEPAEEGQVQIACSLGLRSSQDSPGSLSHYCSDLVCTDNLAQTNSLKNCRCLRAVGKDTKDIRRLVLRLCSSKVFYAVDFLLNGLSICQTFEVFLFTVFLWGLLKPYVVWGEPLPPFFFFFFGRWFTENEICKQSLKILSFIVNAVFKWIMLVPLWSFF